MTGQLEAQDLCPRGHFAPEGLGTFQKAGTVQGRCGPGAVRPAGTLTLSPAGHPACPLDHPV